MQHQERPAGLAAGTGLSGLDDPQTAVFTIGQAAGALGLEVGALRRLDAAGLVSPLRSAGGQRRYSRSQLERVARMQDLMADGLTAAAAGRVADLEDRVADLEGQLVQAQAARDALRRRPR